MKNNNHPFTKFITTPGCMWAIIFFLLWGIQLGFCQSYQWAKSIGSTDYDLGNSITTDASGNVYITGLFQGQADFDPSAGTQYLTPLGSADIFFAKYDVNGNYLWAMRVGGTSSDYGESITADTSGNVYLTGSFEGTADFDPGAGTQNLTSSGSADIFFAKYDSNGNYLWANNIGSTNIDYGSCITVDATGNVYVTGSFGGTADFDPGAGTQNLTPVGSTDFFFAKYDSNGNYLWANSIGSTYEDYDYSITTDSQGNVYITGFFQDTADFDPGAAVANFTAVGYEDIFFAKYDADGNYLWAKSIGSTSTDESYGIAIDSSGNICLAGVFSGTVDFDPGTGTQYLTVAGSTDIFFAKYDANGNYIVAKSIGGAGDDWGYSITTGTSGNVYITGLYSGTADFDPGTGTANLTSVGSKDIFFAKYYAAAPLTASASSSSATTGNCDGSATATASGGITPYTYLWSTSPFQTNATASGLCGNTSFTCLVTGANGETVSVSVFVGEATGINDPLHALQPAFKIYPNPSIGLFTVETAAALDNLSLEFSAYDVMGRLILKTALAGQMAQIDLRGPPPGIYHLQVVTKDAIFNRKIEVK